ncbi:MAG: hypothetical protein PHE17_17950 [Thiothrix sp.]|uniref:recombination directionality factor n=1 Tax=Thiothrix sp. TaxID=1032 RepID=UPI0026305F5C|nr:hypothetical protein [Thiothrix sp.]MDD5394904.1 hypothetical protein [Thiothrix sp.]
MPLKTFECPDGLRIDVTDCLKEGGCRMPCRCATRSYLQLVSRDRPWTGKPSTTQLIQGTMCSFLKIKHGYCRSPYKSAFMVNGTKVHSVLENSEDELSVLEMKFDSNGDNITGISDVIETENGKTILTDYKTWGSFKVAKALGFKIVKEQTGEIFKSGKRKGGPKTRDVLVRDESAVDLWEVELQLNQYRMKAEWKGVKIDELKIQALVRDGNTYIARSRGVFRNIYLFNVKILPDAEVTTYFERKKMALLDAIEDGYCPNVCSGKENWDGLKCSKYCEVAEFCSFGKYLLEERRIEDMPIKGLSEVRRLPRLGKIRLGEKRVTAGGKEYPAELDYFKLDPKTPSELENKRLIEEFQRLYGEKPKTIKIMLPLPDPRVFFPQFFKRYGGSVLKCKGDGETATCISKEFAEGLKITGPAELGGVNVECRGQKCPYYKAKKCKESASLFVLLPDLPGAGVWEIITSSFHSIVNINSCIDYITAVAQRCHMVPLTLERRAQTITHDGMAREHYILHISMSIALSEIQRLAMIDATKILLELPAPEPDKEDLLFQENAIVNAEEAVVAEVQPVVAPTLPPPPASVAPQTPLAAKEPLIGLPERQELNTLIKKVGILSKQWQGWLFNKIGVTTSAGIKTAEYNAILDVLKHNPEVIKSFKVAEKPSLLPREPGVD